MLDIEKLFDEANLGVGAIIFQLVVIPAAVGAIASLLIWKRKLGHISVQRMLVQDDTKGRPVWKLVASSSGRTLNNCRIRAGGQFLLWEGLDSFTLDLGGSGKGIASIPFQVDPGTCVTVKSGAFPIFRNRFGSLEEVCMNK